MGDLGPGWALKAGLGSSPGITMALVGPWGSPFIALNFTLLICLMGKMQLCLQEEDLGDVLSKG